MSAGTYSLQPGQPGQGMDYNVNMALPYPILLEEGLTAPPGSRGVVSAGDKLIGFQRGDAQTLVLTTEQFEENPGQALGLVPVFSDGAFYALNVPVTKITRYGATSKDSYECWDRDGNFEKGL